MNLKVWTESNEENRTTVIYEHYRKEVSTKSTVHYRSAMGMKQKRSILTQELLTIMINCSPLLNETKRKEHINEYMKRLQFLGYNEEFRYDVLRNLEREPDLYTDRSIGEGRKEKQRNKKRKSTGTNVEVLKASFSYRVPLTRS